VGGAKRPWCELERKAVPAGMKAVVIGGGLGGLATALRLRARGWQVVVCEANPTLGGKMNRFARDCLVFDTGPSLITMPHVFRELYTAVGEHLEDHVSFMPVRPFADYHFSSGAHVLCPAGIDEWRSVVGELEPRDVRGVDRLYEVGRKVYELSARTFFRRSPLSPPSLRELMAFRFLPLRDAWGNYARTVERHIRNPLLRMIYLRYATYVGSSPYCCPATLLVIPYIEQAFGAWHVQGGLYSIVESLARLAADRGVELRTSARVAAIERNPQRATGVRLADGNCIVADAVVMNGDSAATAELLDRKVEIDAASRSMSGVVLLCRASQSNLRAHHTVFFSADYAAEFDQLTVERKFPEDPTVYISAPRVTDETASSGFFAMANAPAIAKPWSGRDVELAIDAVRRRLDTAGIHLNGEDVLDVWHPGRFAQAYLAPYGSIYGANSHGWRNAFLRTPNRSRDLRGLYFVGGSSHPGGGTPTVLLSAGITAGLVDGDARA